MHKYLSQVDGDYPNIRAHAANTFEDLTSKTIRTNRKYVDGYSSVMDLWEKEKQDIAKATRLMGYLPEEKIDQNELFSVLQEVFAKDENSLLTKDSLLSTNLKRLIRFYDFLHWGKRKDLIVECP